jgi:DNA-binding CsgD family transcriptional regulator
MQPTQVYSRSLVGRRDELSHLHDRRRDASAARGGLVLVAGEAGLGKSRLLFEFRRDLTKARVKVGSSQCSEFAQRPYAAVLDALADVGSGEAAFAPAVSRIVQFEAIASSFRVAARSRCLVVFIEDIHWADPASVELLWTVAREAAASRILIVATYRPEVIRDDHPLFPGLARLERLPSASAIRLQRLDDRDLRSLIDGALHGAAADVPYETRSAVARLSDGNPLFAEELLKTAVDRMHAGASAPSLPTTIRAAVLERLRPLSAAEQTVLAQAAVIGRRFSAELLGATAGTSMESILEALRHARSLQLIEEEGPGEFTFHHALTREAIYESFLAAQVRDFHARIAGAIESLPPGRRALQDLAYHWWAASDRTKAAAYGEQAGDAAEAVYAYDEAARLYGYSLDSVDRTSAKAAALLVKIGLAHGKIGSKALARDAMDEARANFRRLGDVAGECDACIEYVAALYSLKTEDCDTPLVELRTRLGAPEHRRLRVRVDVALAQLMSLGSTGDPSALLDAVAEDLPDDDLRLLTIYHATRAAVAAKRSDVGTYRASAKESLRSARATGNPNYQGVVLSNAASAFSDLGQYEDADRYFAEAEAFARKHNLPSTLAFVCATRAKRRLLGGDLSGARDDVLEAIAVGPDYEVARPFIAGSGTALGMLLDDDALLAQCFNESLIGRGNPVQIAAPFAERLISLGREEDAQMLLRSAIASAGDPRVPFELFVALARHATGEDIARARAIAAEFSSSPQDVVYKATLPLFDAITAFRAGDVAAMNAHARAAVSAFRGLGCPQYEAEALEIAGDADAAAAIYKRIGAVQPLRRLQLSSAGARSRGAARDVSSLTEREREVAELIGRGLSNAEIADRMSVSLKTVEKHLGSIYVKLGINSRNKLMAHLFAHSSSAR